jgi:peptide/nickel transport system substrate-binding protein
MRKSAFVISLLLVLIMVLSACGANKTSSSNSKYGGVLTVVPGPYGNFTDNFAVYAPGGNVGTLGMIYETLLYFNRETGKVSPWLASSYQLASDAKSITFTIRQGVKWSDGQPFSADDVVFTLNYMKQYPAIDTNALWQTIDTVNKTDANTVVVTFKQPSSSMLWYLGGQTYIVPQHIWSSITDPATNTNTKPIGTGPFVLKSFSPQLYVLGRNTNYWQPGKPYINEIHYPALNSNTSADLVLSQGSLDWAGLFTPNIQQTFVNRDPTHNKYWFPPSGLTVLYMNLTKFPFNDLAVRQAINLAVDRQQMSQKGEDGYQAVASPTGLLLPNFQSYLSSDYSSSSYSVDTAKANSILTSAGYTKGSDGIYEKGGKKLSFNMNVVSGWTDWVTDVQIMSSDLKNVGMNVTVNAISYNSYYSALQLGTFDTAISWTAGGPTPFFTYYGLMSSAQSAPVGKAAPQNWERWNNTQTDQLLNQYAGTADSTQQQQAIQGLEKFMVEQIPAVPLIYGSTWYEYSTARFTGWPDQNNTYAVPAPWSYPDDGVVAQNLHPVSSTVP